MASEDIMDYFELPRKKSPLFRDDFNHHARQERKNSYTQFQAEEAAMLQSKSDDTTATLITRSDIRKAKLHVIFNEFVGYCTMHGFHFIFDKVNKFRRFIWIVFIALSMGFVSQKLYESTRKYLNRPFTTTTTVNYMSEIQFPAISICNVNDLRMSKMHRTLLHKIMSSGNAVNLEKQISGELYAKTIEEANHRIEDMLYSCTIMNRKCTHGDFKPFYQTQGEKCFTFFNPKNMVNQTGVKEGLELILNIEHYEYYHDTVDAGIRVIIHNPEETPVRMQGVTLPPGMTSYIRIKKSKNFNLGNPYKTNCGKPLLKYFTHYTENTCWVERLTDHVTKMCECKDGFMPGIARVCSLEELVNCTWPEWEKFNRRKDIGCPIACEEIDFDSYLSFAMFPSNKWADKVATDMNLTGNVQENRKFIRDNFLRVILYFKHLSVVQMEQTPSYDFMVFLGDIGGQLGLFLGTSILTMLEFFDIIAMAIYTKYFELYRPRVETPSR